jgi:N-carbamoylputrescine amidase
VRIALAQLDSRLDDPAANERATRAALATDADLVVFPELQLTGYGPAEGREVADVAQLAAGATALLGFHERDGDRTHNSAAYVDHGEVVHVQRKLYLPHYLRFTERDLFAPGDSLRAFDAAGGRAATLICNDAWQPMLPFIAVQDGAQIIFVPSASSTAVEGVDRYWFDLTRYTAQMLECFVVFVNRVGTDSGFTFWGGSHVVDPRGTVVAEAPRFEETVLVVDLDLEQVERQRRELPLLANDARLDLLQAELSRLRSR